jgi:hypothetical protein
LYRNRGKNTTDGFFTRILQKKIYFVRHLWRREAIESYTITTPSDFDAKKPRQAFPVSTMDANYKKSCCVGGK